MIGTDGMQLLIAVWAEDVPDWLAHVPAVEILRQTWVHQYYVENDQVRLRAASDLAPSGSRFDSPYDIDARFGNKRSVTWTGYKVHLTETCDENQVHLITHTITTQAQVSDVTQTAPIHEALAAKDLLPSQHIVDAGYVDSNLIVTSRKQYRLVRSLRLTDSTWVALGITSECLGLTRADYLEQITGEKALPSTVAPSNTPEKDSLFPCITRQSMDSPPSNTRHQEEIEVLKAEIQNLSQKNAALMERTAIASSQVVELELLRDRILMELKLGKQAPGYKAVQKALNRFIAELTYPNTSIF